MRRSHHTLFTTCFALILAWSAFAADVIDPSKGKADEKEPILWYDLRLVGIEGQGWKDTKAPFDRLPAKAEATVRKPVWDLSRHSAGMCARFVTDATTIKARWTLTSDRIEMPHMAATGVSGLDVRHDGKWKWLNGGRPAKGTSQQATLATGLPAGTREYLLYLPLYNGVTSVEVGIPKDSKLSKPDARAADRQKPILFYGTSITHGACASRPGMTHPAILGRRFDRPVINLGFSGNGKMDPEVGTLLTELDPAVYVIDCLPNLTAPEVAERTEPLVRTLRKAHAGTPILLVEDRTYPNSFLMTNLKQRNQDSRAALKKAYDKLIADGVKGLHYLEGDKLLGDDNEGTVDNSHPTDLGFVRHADAFEKVLAPLLRGESKK